MGSTPEVLTPRLAHSAADERQVWARRATESTSPLGRRTPARTAAATHRTSCWPAHTWLAPTTPTRRWGGHSAGRLPRNPVAPQPTREVSGSNCGTSLPCEALNSVPANGPEVIRWRVLPRTSGQGDDRSHVAHDRGGRCRSRRPRPLEEHAVRGSRRRVRAWGSGRHGRPVDVERSIVISAVPVASPGRRDTP
jgi:hypothetical protein